MSDDRQWPGEDDPLNRAALRALLGFEDDREGPLVELLRSRVAIHWTVRQALAGALSGTLEFGAPLKFARSSPTREHVKAAALRRRNYLLGKSILQQRAAGHGWVDTMEHAGGTIARGRGTAENARQYAIEVDAWVAEQLQPGSLYCDWSEEELRERYFAFTARGAMPPSSSASVADLADVASSIVGKYAGEGSEPGD